MSKTQTNFLISFVIFVFFVIVYFFFITVSSKNEMDDEDENKEKIVKIEKSQKNNLVLTGNKDLIFYLDSSIIYEINSKIEETPGVYKLRFLVSKNQNVKYQNFDLNCSTFESDISNEVDSLENLSKSKKKKTFLKNDNPLGIGSLNLCRSFLINKLKEEISEINKQINIYKEDMGDQKKIILNLTKKPKKLIKPKEKL